MLTENQNKIISDLRDEFAKLNKTEGASTRHSLINRAEIDNVISESARILAEHNAMSESLLKAMKDKVDDDVKRLNEDLIDMGLVASNTSDEFYANGLITKPNLRYKSYQIKWSYICETSYVKLPDGTTHSYKNKLSYIHVSYSINGYERSNRFSSIEEVFANEYIKNALINLYKCK